MKLEDVKPGQKVNIIDANARLIYGVSADVTFTVQSVRGDLLYPVRIVGKHKDGRDALFGGTCGKLPHGDFTPGELELAE